MSPTLEGGFSSNGPPGKPLQKGLVSFKLVPQECLFYLECGLGEKREHIGEYSNAFSILSEVWHGFLERAHSTPAENCGLEGKPL